MFCTLQNANPQDEAPLSSVWLLKRAKLLLTRESPAIEPSGLGQLAPNLLEGHLLSAAAGVSALWNAVGLQSKVPNKNRAIDILILDLLGRPQRTCAADAVTAGKSAWKRAKAVAALQKQLQLGDHHEARLRVLLESEAPVGAYNTLRQPTESGEAPTPITGAKRPLEASQPLLDPAAPDDSPIVPRKLAMPQPPVQHAASMTRSSTASMAAFRAFSSGMSDEEADTHRSWLAASYLARQADVARQSVAHALSLAEGLQTCWSQRRLPGLTGKYCFCPGCMVINSLERADIDLCDGLGLGDNMRASVPPVNRVRPTDCPCCEREFNLPKYGQVFARCPDCLRDTLLDSDGEDVGLPHIP